MRGVLKQKENDSVRPRGVISEVEQFLEGGRIKSWVQWLEGGRIGSYSGGVVSAAPPRPSPPSSQFQKEEEEDEGEDEGKEEEEDRGKWEEVSNAIEFVVQGITEMVEAEALNKACLVGRVGWREGTTNYCGGFYGYGDDGES